MNTNELLEFLKRNQYYTLAKTAKLFKMTRHEVKAIAERYNITFPTKEKWRELCKNAPMSCFDCPLPECWNLNSATKKETEFLLTVMETDRPNQKKYRKDNGNDKQED